jgi:amino acid adenylation domain-containing protein
LTHLDASAQRVFVFKASEAQGSLWFLDQLAPGQCLYNLHVGKRIDESIDVDVLEASVNEVVRRHEALRTAFRHVDDELTQLIASTLLIPLAVTDLRHLPEDERETQALGIADEEAGTPFDLAKWPLIRTHLVRTGDLQYIFLLTIHHIVCDYWSLQILEDEISAIYAAFSTNHPSPFPELPLQYADFSEWERGWLNGPDGKQQLSSLTERLADLPLLQLPADYSRPHIPTFSGAAIDFVVGQTTYERLLRLGSEQNGTLFMVALAGLQTVLHRYTDSEDIVLGTSVANRSQADAQGLVGYLVNTLVLRTDLSGDPTFRELVERASKTAIDAFNHSQVPFNMVVSALRPERIVGDNPLFQVHFQLFSEGPPSSSTGLLAGEAFESEATTAQFDLGLDLWESDGLTGHIEYSTDVFSHETVQSFSEHFLRVLDIAAEEPDRRISEISPLDEDDIHRLTVDWNDTGGTDDTDDTDETAHDTELLHRMFELVAARHPSEVAVIDGPDRLTYGEVDARSTRLATQLRSRGIGCEDIVAISAERSATYVISTLATLKAGAAFLPVNLLDSPERLNRLLDQARPKLLVSRNRRLEHLLGTVEILDPEAAFRDVSEWNGAASLIGADCSADGLAYVIFTSGSTGEPRGVEISHRAAANHFRWMQEALSLTARDRTLLKYPLTFDAAVCELFYPLLAGATLVVAPTDEHWNVSEFVRLCQEQEITVLDLVPSMLDTLLGEPGFPDSLAIRRVICGGEELTRDLCERFFAKSDAELYNIYGPTEATIGTTGWACREDESSSVVPIGRPIANSRAYILDTSLQPAPVGVRGELYIAGRGLARGYLNDPAGTAERFVPDRFSVEPGARMYRTGDRAWYSRDGVIHYAGRTDTQLKIRGYRVESAEVEAELSRHPMVRRCTVMPEQDDRNRKRLVAYVLPQKPPAELWPSVGDYGVYDELLYYALTHDKQRNDAYRSAIASAVPGKVVVDLGTGADAILARYCAEAGARHVYAVEVSRRAFESAVATVRDLGLSDQITILHGDSTEVTLPEPVDVCVSELIGMIGSSEGVVPILNDAWRLLKNDAVMVPWRCVTKFAPFTLPQHLADSPRLVGLPRQYTQEVFAKVGRPFDLRLCIKNCPAENLLAEPRVFEDLDFSAPADADGSSDASFTISADGRLDGFLFWLNLHPDHAHMVDSLIDPLSWLPVFMPAFEPGIQVSAGDVVNVHTETRVARDGRLPDYALEGVVERRDGGRLAFSVSSPNETEHHRATPFYDRLLGDLDVSDQSGAPDDGSILDLGPSLRHFLRQRLPDYMIPSSFVILDPATSVTGGKLDLRKLAGRHRRPGGDQRPGLHGPATEAEQLIGGVWCNVLNMSRVDRRDNFFDLGGDSLLIAQVRVELELLFSRPIPITELFRYPTVSSLGAFLSEGEPTSASLNTPRVSDESWREPALDFGATGG